MDKTEIFERAERIESLIDSLGAKYKRDMTTLYNRLIRLINMDYIINFLRYPQRLINNIKENEYVFDYKAIIRILAPAFVVFKIAKIRNIFKVEHMKKHHSFLIAMIMSIVTSFFSGLLELKYAYFELEKQKTLKQWLDMTNEKLKDIRRYVFGFDIINLIKTIIRYAIYSFYYNVKWSLELSKKYTHYSIIFMLGLLANVFMLFYATKYLSEYILIWLG